MIVPLYQNPDRDGGPLGWQNCGVTVTAEQIAFETGGTQRPTVDQVRRHCLNADGSADLKGGTRPSQLVDAAQRGWGVQLDYRVMPFEDVWKLGARDDYLMSISISYAPVSGTRLDGSPGFRGLHNLGLSGGLVYDPLADGRRPGIPNGPQRWPKDLLRRAAGKYAGVGEGRAAVIVARAPATKPKRYSIAFDPGAFFIYVTSTLRLPDEGFSKRTSAPCTAPFLTPWAGGQKRLVAITAGRLAGRRVEPGATHLALKEAKS